MLRGVPSYEVLVRGAVIGVGGICFAVVGGCVGYDLSYEKRGYFRSLARWVVVFAWALRLRLDLSMRGQKVSKGQIFLVVTSLTRGLCCVVARHSCSMLSANAVLDKESVYYLG